MLTLAEPCILDSFLDRPHLGCAMLIAACQEKGIKTALVKGQTRYLKDIFVNDSEELWGLIQDLDEDVLERMEETSFTEVIKSVREKGARQFQDELKNIYQYAVVDKNPRHYLDVRRMSEFKLFHEALISVYFYYIIKLKRCNLRIIDRYVSEIIKTNPCYVAFSLEGSFEPLSRAVRRRIKELIEVPIIVGGALTPFIDLKELDKIFEREYFDYLVIGAGEQALPSLIEAIESDKEPEGIANVFYKKNNKIKGNDIEVVGDLDSLPYPDYSQFDLGLYAAPKRILPLQTARGCSWRKCAFCSHHNIDLGNYKTFSVKKVIETIRHLQDTYNCSHFAFHDEELPPGRAKRISEAILSNGLENINICTYARLVDGYNNDELLRLMRRAGFSLVHWGMESGCQRVLDLINKGIKVSVTEQILKKSSKNNIANLCFIFFGFPGETAEEAQQTVDFLKKNADYIEEIGNGQFYMERYSPIGKNPKGWGVDLKEDGTYSTETGLSRKEVSAFFNKFIEEFKMNSVRVTSDRLRYLMHGSNCRMLHFLNSSYILLSNSILLERLKRGKLSGIFPIILGETKKRGDRIIFLPVNINEPHFINQYFPVKGMVLDSLQEKIFILSDGRLSIEEIILSIYKDFKKRPKKEYIYKRCVGIFDNIFSKNWGLGFAKSWRSS